MKKGLFLVLLSIYSFLLKSQNDILSNECLASLIDSIVFNNMEKYQVPGVGYAVVKNDQILQIGSKGQANIEKSIPVQFNTKFMLGSIAKLFTTVAVLQLYEEGKVKLNVDINAYLSGFKLPYEVTLRQLLTHTAGLEESVFDRVKLSKAQVLPLGDYLRTHLPEQILPPGKYAAYSNHGMALVGLVIQEVSGLRFEDFVQQRVFSPLNMNNSSFYLNEESKQSLATSYRLKKGNLWPTQLEYVQTVPASMLISTATDMAKFMVFMIQENNSVILEPETIRLMKSEQFSHHSKLWGRGLGFFRRDYRGVQMIEHGGSRNGYYGQLTFVEKDSIGIFVVYNGVKSNFRNKVTFDFFGSIYPKIERKINFNEERVNLSEYEGTYISNRRSESDFGRLILQSTFVEKIEVEIENSQSLSVLGSMYSLESKDQFDISNSPTSSFPIAFGRNELGSIDSLFLPGRSDSFHIMKWYEHELIGLITFALSFLVFLAVTILGLVKGLLNNFFRYRFIYSFFNFSFLLSFIIMLTVSGESLQYEIPEVMYLIFALPIIGVLFLGPSIFHFIRNWKGLSSMNKIMNLMFLIGSLIYSWQLHYWNFLGFNF